MSPSSRFEDLTHRTVNLCSFHLQALPDSVAAMRATGPPTSNRCDIDDCDREPVIRIFPRSADVR